MRKTKYLNNDTLTSSYIYNKINKCSAALPTIFLAIVQDFIVKRRVELFIVMKESIPLDCILLIFGLFYEDQINECVSFSDVSASGRLTRQYPSDKASANHRCEIFGCSVEIPDSLSTRYCSRHLLCECGFSRMFGYCRLHDVQSCNKYNKLCSTETLYMDPVRSKYIPYNIDYTQLYKRENSSSENTPTILSAKHTCSNSSEEGS